MYPLKMTLKDFTGFKYVMTIHCQSKAERDLKLDALSRGEWTLTDIQEVKWEHPLREKK